MNLLLVVDPQVDFTTGSLAVRGGPQAVDALAAALAGGAARDYGLVVVTQDWHPADHCSFTEKGGPFPAHCVQGTAGAELHPSLRAALDAEGRAGRVVRFTKGNLAGREEFSVFQNAENGPRLRKAILDGGFDRIDVCGIASDYCVLTTLRDLLEFWPAGRTRVLVDCVAAVADGKPLFDLMAERGVAGATIAERAKT